MRTDVIKYCTSCDACNRRKTSPHQKKAPLQRFTSTIEPWELTSMDIDYFTKYVEAIPVPDLKADTIARAFVENVIVRHGTPQKLLTDRGTNFMSSLFKEVCGISRIRKIQTSSYAPTSNGQIERMHRKETPKEAKPIVTAEVHCNSPKQRVYTEVFENTEEAKTTRVNKFNERTSDPQFEVGDTVYVRDKSSKRGLSQKLVKSWIGPYRITEKIGPVTCKVRKCKGRDEQTVHVNRLKPYINRISEGIRERTLKRQGEIYSDSDETELVEEVEETERARPLMLPCWNRVVGPDSDEEEMIFEEEIGGTDEEVEHEEPAPVLRRSTRIRRPPNRLSYD
ncbi:uncharacterized protein LOC123306929 [Coccinella septempunctata]|uniref:uncharacterized protein LOC123306929 n=1 Tax=Coccinella septempunctata TaxID=41139 RepID=UPI001D0742D5|nr:uncharacterized protein LOC123306929 [Coccinella septempunctata]